VEQGEYVDVVVDRSSSLASSGLNLFLDVIIARLLIFRFWIIKNVYGDKSSCAINLVELLPLDRHHEIKS